MTQYVIYLLILNFNINVGCSGGKGAAEQVVNSVEFRSLVLHKLTIGNLIITIMI